MIRLFLALTCFCLTAFGQSRAKDAPERIEPAYFDVSATDVSGQFVAGLKASDFTVSRGGMPLKVVSAAAPDVTGSRTLVLIVDDLGLSLDGLRQVRNALWKFVAEQVRPDDRVSILRTGAGAGQFQRLTADKAVLSEAIERLDYSPIGDPDRARWKSFTAGTLLQLRFALDGMKEMPGRKTVVLFSERLTIPSSAGAEAFAEIESMATRIAELANQGMATLYVVHAKPSAPSLAPRVETGLAMVVRESGGLWIDNSPDLSAALARVRRDEQSYYLLGFQPDAHSYDYMSGRDHFTRMAAKVSRNDVTLRSRTVVYGAVDDEKAGVPSESYEEIIKSPFAGEIAMRATPIFSSSAAEGSAVDVLIHVDGKRLTYVRTLNGVYRAAVRVGSTAFGTSGQSIAENDRVSTPALSEEAYRHVLENGFLFSIRIPLSRPGAYQIRTIVSDEATEKSGTSGQYFEVPDLQKGELAVSGILLRPGSKEPLDTATQTRQSSAVRIFRHGDILGYTYQVSGVHSAGEVQAKILRDDEVVFVGQVTKLPEGASNSVIRLVNGSLSLGPELPSGRYRFEVNATDQLDGQTRKSVQWVDLEIRK